MPLIPISNQRTAPQRTVSGVLLGAVAGFSLLMNPALLMAQTSDQTAWETVVSSDSSSATARHESGVVASGSKLFLMGGRATRPLEVFDPATARWTNLGAMPGELHHFQPVTIGSKIYIVGALTCCYPNEPSVAEIHVYDTLTQSWSIEGTMPANRTRGSAGAVVRDNKIYLVGGNTLGHSGGAVNWFDEYDPATGEWRELPDAPNARDHFSAVLVDNKLVAAAGRQSSTPNPFKNPVAATDVYDFQTATWQSMSDIPTVRAGVIASDAGDEVIVVGGEIDTTSDALATVEAFNVHTGVWRTLQSMPTARHSGGGARLGDTLHVIAGSMSRGGAPETSVHETLALDITTNPDFDNDGLSNDDELNVHGTDPQNADSDEDGLSDGVEVGLGSNPLVVDTDADTLSDESEVNVHGTNPLLADSDSDGLNDVEELQNDITDPLLADTDSDGLLDGEEITLGTLPNDADTDKDGVVDGQDSDPLNVPAKPGSGGSLSLWVMLALAVGLLSRIRACFVNISTKKRVCLFCH